MIAANMNTTHTLVLDYDNPKLKEVVIYDCGEYEYYSHFSIRLR